VIGLLILFLVLAVAAAILGFGGILQFAIWLFWIFLVIFLVVLIFRFLVRRT
jgi:uncharacterized membrane protein YtjA (UPF0391 family)